jgi:hypothetical protein
MNGSPLSAVNPDLSMVSAMITPAILILAAASLVSSTLVRLGRIVDQTRALIARGEQLRAQGKEAELPAVESRMRRQLRRAEIARRALWGYYVAIALFLLSSIVLAIDQATHGPFEWLGPSITLLGGVVLMLATLALVLEVSLSAGSLREEISSYHQQIRAG